MLLNYLLKTYSSQKKQLSIIPLEIGGITNIIDVLKVEIFVSDNSSARLPQSDTLSSNLSITKQMLVI